MKAKALNESQFLELLQKVLSEVTKDAHLASQILQGVTREVNLRKSLQSFEKFCEEGSMPDAEAQTVTNLQEELSAKFGEGAVTVQADETGQALEVEIALPDRTVNTKVKVVPADQAAEEAPEAPFVPFPVALPNDPGLVWVLGRRENFGPDEATRALGRIEEEFWASKKGQVLQQKGVEKCFAEFIVEVPASALGDSGLKRHYKTPEALHTLHMGPRVEEAGAKEEAGEPAAAEPLPWEE